MNFDFEKTLPIIGATADPSNPYWIGKPETKAYAIPCGIASRATFNAALQSEFKDVAEYSLKVFNMGKRLEKCIFNF